MKHFRPSSKFQVFSWVFPCFTLFYRTTRKHIEKNTYCLNKKYVSVFLGCHNSRKMFPVFVFNMFSPIADQVGDRRWMGFQTTCPSRDKLNQIYPTFECFKLITRNVGCMWCRVFLICDDQHDQHVLNHMGSSKPTRNWKLSDNLCFWHVKMRHVKS
jgi:hypothetical protein